jgi:hypothetical protein
MGMNMADLINEDADATIDARTKIDKDYIFTFGQFKGENVKTVMQVNSGYFLYLDKTGNFLIDDSILSDAKANMGVRDKIMTQFDRDVIYG